MGCRQEPLLRVKCPALRDWTGRFVGLAARCRTVELVTQSSRLASRSEIVRRVRQTRQGRAIRASWPVALTQKSQFQGT